MIDHIKSFYPVSSDNFTIVYRYKDSGANISDFCGVTEEMQQQYRSLADSPASANAGQSSSGCLLLEIATDADYEWYQHYGSNSRNEKLAIINMAEGVFVNTFDIYLRVGYQNVWTTSSDPYTGSGASSAKADQLLNQLRNQAENR